MGRMEACGWMIAASLVGVALLGGYRAARADSFPSAKRHPRDGPEHVPRGTRGRPARHARRRLGRAQSDGGQILSGHRDRCGLPGLPVRLGRRRSIRPSPRRRCLEPRAGGCRRAAQPLPSRTLTGGAMWCHASWLRHPSFGPDMSQGREDRTARFLHPRRADAVLGSAAPAVRQPLTPRRAIRARAGTRSPVLAGLRSGQCRTPGQKNAYSASMARWIAPAARKPWPSPGNGR